MVLEAILGTLTGLGGTALTSILNYRQQKLKNEHEAKMAEIDHKNMLEEAKINLQVTEMDIQKDLELAAGKSFDIAQRAASRPVVSSEMISKLFDNKYTAWLGSILVLILGIIEAVRSSIRPGVTVVLMWMTGYILLKSIHLVMNDKVVMDEATINGIIDSIVYLTFSVVMFWFGDRRTAKFAKRLNDGNFVNK